MSTLLNKLASDENKRRLSVFYGRVFLFAFRVIYLFTRIRIRIGTLRVDRIGHLALNTDLMLRQWQLNGKASRTFDIFLVKPPISNRQLLEMYKRHLRIVENPWLVQHFWGTWYKFFTKTDYFIHCPDHASNEFDLYAKTKPILSFTPEEEEKGRAGLKKIGIDPDNDWFVCIYARDSGYLDKVTVGADWSYHDFRNADIDNFIRAAKYIVRQGGYVVRLGYVVNKAFGFQHEKVIDYALGDRSDFMDIYLAAKCRFLVGTSAGITDITKLMGVPFVGVDYTPPGMTPLTADSIHIPKKVLHIETGVLVPLNRMINSVCKSNADFFDGHVYRKRGFAFIENTDKEILEVTVEMYQRLEGTFKESDEDRANQERFRAIYPEDHWMYGTPSPIGRDFLRNNRELFFGE